MKPKQMLFLAWYSVKSLLWGDLVSTLSILKRAKTWSYVFYAILFIMAYYGKLTLLNGFLVASAIFVLYMIRQRKEPEFNVLLTEQAFLQNDDEIIRKHYNRYVKECFYTKHQPVEYEEYKKEEKLKIIEKKNIESEENDTEY